MRVRPASTRAIVSLAPALRPLAIRVAFFAFTAALLIVAPPVRAAEAPAHLDFRAGDRVAIVGGGLADRMQHAGDLEAMIQLRFPAHGLAFRNLGFAGDEVTTRMRSENFGTPDEWLERVGADVIWAFFGANESWRGPEGLADFKASFASWLDATLAKNYGGKGAPRVVVFSPTALERLDGVNLPDPAPIEKNLALYSAAMAETAAAKGVLFVDLMPISRAAYERESEPLTINGAHLRDAGYAAIAPGMFRALFGEDPPATSGAGPVAAAFAKLRDAVNEKNAMWFSRYRTVDGYNVYGGRSYLKFGDQMNRDVLLHEMSVRDVMTANREARVHALARGEDKAVDDSNAPPPMFVPTNKPGEGPEGVHVFLGGEQAIERMKVPPGCVVNLFAAEDRFPELANPVQMNFDAKGRLWVATWPNYPERTPWSTKGDALLIFEDDDKDGRADRAIPFLEDLNCPTGFQFHDDGVLVVQAPDVWFARDTDGDDRADTFERVLNGLDSADSHHTANALCLEPGGATYLSDGVFHRTQMESAWGPPVRNIDAAIYRFEPRTFKIERYIAYGFANPHGRVFDHWGNDLVTDATGNNTYFGPAFSGRIDHPDKHSELRQFWNRPSRPCPATAILYSRHFPDDMQGEFLNANVIGFQGVYRVDVTEDGSGLRGETVDPPLVVSDDPNFRPIALDVAPDGSIYFLDWHNPIIGHMQHHIRDPSRDHQHGRIYRITYPSRPLLEPKPIAGRPVAELLELLLEPENNVRTRAKTEIGTHDPKEVAAAVEAWRARFDPKKAEDAHALLEALWVHQWVDVPNESLLRAMLASPEPRARAQALRVLGYWRDRVSEPLAALGAAVEDPAPRVRLEALRVLSFFEGPEPMELAHRALLHETDYYLEYVFKETKRQLEKSNPGVFLPKDPRALAALVKRLPDSALLAAEGVEPVLAERLRRPGTTLVVRTSTLAELARARGEDPVKTALDALRSLDESGEAGGAATGAALDLGVLLASYPPARLRESRAEFEALAADGRSVAAKRAGHAGIVAMEGDPGAAWARTEGNPGARAALIGSIAMHSDPDFRAKFAPSLEAVLADSGAPGFVRAAALRALPLMGPERAGESFALLAARLRAGDDAFVAAQSILQIPREAWNAELAAPAVEAILARAAATPEEKRTEVEFVDAIQAGMELATLLPAADALRLRKSLHALSVPVFSLRSLREQMRFDLPRIVVEKGKAFEIVFENVDMMPHNVTILEPGSREEIGAKSDRMGPDRDSRGRTYVPDDKRVLAATKMVEPGMKETLKVKALETPGAYEYVCTYPEHWKSMYGTLLVVESMDAWLASEESAAPAKQPEGEAHVH